MANIQEAIQYAKLNPDSAFANELKRRIESGQMNSELQSAGLTQYLPQTTLDKAKDVAIGFGKGVAKTALDTATGLQDIGQGALGLISDKAYDPSMGIEALKTETPQGQNVVQSVTPTNDLQKLGGQLETGAEILAGGGASLIKGAVKGGSDLAVKGATAIAENPAVKGAVDLTKMAGESLARVPSRLATNVAEKQAQETAIKSLPTKTAQIAARDGVDITDVKNLSNIKVTPETSKLIKTVQDFANGNTKTDPIEIVGKPIVQRVKQLNKEKDVVGAKLSEVAQNLGIVTKPELTNGVFNALSGVPSLKGLQLTPKGVLDFSKTTLADATRVADRKEIQTLFKEATKWGDGLKAHNFRQSLFETLGGKKKSLANITDTVDNATNAIRKGLSDVLETKNPEYKKLSNEYRKIVQPLGDLRKLMKNIDPNSSEDILNMSAGLLARRITSAAPSNPQVKQLLTALDNAGTKGGVRESVTQLQDVYNILNKYYDIAPKTGFQNLVKQGIEGGDSLAGMAKEALKNVAGQSNAVRQKALEDFLKEIGALK